MMVICCVISVQFAFYFFVKNVMFAVLFVQICLLKSILFPHEMYCFVCSARLLLLLLPCLLFGPGKPGLYAQRQAARQSCLSGNKFPTRHD